MVLSGGDSVRLYCASWDPVSGPILKLPPVDEGVNIEIVDVDDVDDLDDELGALGGSSSHADGLGETSADSLEPPFALVRCGSTSLLVKKTDFDWKAVAEKRLTLAQTYEWLIRRISDTIRTAYANTARGADVTVALGGSAAGCCGPNRDYAKVAQSIGYSDQDLTAAGEANLGLGCGNPVSYANLREGETLMDLGSGAGFYGVVFSGGCSSPGVRRSSPPVHGISPVVYIMQLPRFRPNLDTKIFC